MSKLERRLNNLQKIFVILPSAINKLIHHAAICYFVTYVLSGKSVFCRVIFGDASQGARSRRPKASDAIVEIIFARGHCLHIAADLASAESNERPFVDHDTDHKPGERTCVYY